MGVAGTSPGMRSGSWVKMRSCSRCRTGDGSIPSSSTSRARNRAKLRRASDTRPDRYRASITSSRPRSLKASSWIADSATDNARVGSPFSRQGRSEVLQRLEAQLPPSVDMWTGELLEPGIGEWLPTPDRERSLQRLHGARGVGVEPLATPAHQLFEPVDVDVDSVGLDDVAGASRHDGGVSSCGDEPATQLGDVDLQGVTGRTRRAAVPEQLDEAVDADDVTALEEQRHEERSLLGRPQVHQDRALVDLERAQHADQQRSGRRQRVLGHGADVGHHPPPTVGPTAPSERSTGQIGLTLRRTAGAAR